MEIPNNTSRPVGIPATWKDPAGTEYRFLAAWQYRNLAGEPVGIVARFDTGDAKQVIRFSSRARAGVSRRAARKRLSCMARKS